MKAACYAGAFAALSFFVSSSVLALDCALLQGGYTAINADNYDMSSDDKTLNHYFIRHVERAVVGNDAPYVLRITEKRQKLAYDFSFAYANGFGGTHLSFLGPAGVAPVPEKQGDPAGSLQYYGEDLRIISLVDEVAPKAPAYLALPGLGASFWYWAPGKKKFIPPDGLWKLTECG